MGLDPSLRSLHEIRQLSRPSDRIKESATLLEYILKSFEPNRAIQPRFNVLLESNLEKFTEGREVFFALDARNGLTHVPPKIPQSKWPKAARVFDQAIQDVCQYILDEEMVQDILGTPVASPTNLIPFSKPEPQSEPLRPIARPPVRRQPIEEPTPPRSDYSRRSSPPAYAASPPIQSQSSVWWFVVGVILLAAAVVFWTANDKTVQQFPGPTPSVQPTINPPLGSSTAEPSDDSKHVYINQRFGYRVSYPPYLRPQGESEGHDRQNFISDDGTLSLSVWGMDQGQWTFDGFYEYDDSNVITTSKVREKDFYIKSGVSGTKIFYERLTLRGQVFWGFRLEYDQSKEVEYADLPDAITKSFVIPINEVSLPPKPTLEEIRPRDVPDYVSRMNPGEYRVFNLPRSGDSFIETPFHIRRDAGVELKANGRFEIAWADNVYPAHCSAPNACRIIICPTGSEVTLFRCSFEPQGEPLQRFSSVYPETTFIRVRNTDVDPLRLTIERN